MLERPPRKPPPPSKQELRRERHRRHRERVKHGERELNWLIRIGWISSAEADQGDARLIGQAIAAGLAASAKG